MRKEYISKFSGNTIDNLLQIIFDGGLVKSIEKTSSVGLVDTYTITYLDDSTEELEITNGRDGTDGTDGRGIISIVKTSTEGLVDTYTITYTDNTTSTFNVTNGKDGVDGTNGTNGTDGVGIVSITKTGTSGLVDTYTITYSNNTTSTFQVTNGANGQDGTDGQNGVGVPTGGTTGQVLKKKSNTDYDTEWANESGGGGVSSFNGLTGSIKVGGLRLNFNGFHNCPSIPYKLNFKNSSFGAPIYYMGYINDANYSDQDFGYYYLDINGLFAPDDRYAIFIVLTGVGDGVSSINGTLRAFDGTLITSSNVSNYINQPLLLYSDVTIIFND